MIFPRLAFLSLFGLLLGHVFLRADHGATEDWTTENKEKADAWSKLLRNETLPVFWSPDGRAVAYSPQDEAGKRSWKLIELETGTISDLDGKPEDFVKGAERRPVAEPETKEKIVALESRRGARSHDGKHQVEIRDGAIFLDGQRRLEAPGEGWKWEGKPVWAPDSSRVAVFKTTDHPVREVHFVRSSPEESLQPEHFTHPYPKPGDELNLPVPVILFLDERDPIEVSPELIRNPFSLRDFGWRPDSRRFLFEYIERGFGSHRIIEIDTESESAEDSQRILVDETDKFVFVFGNSFRKDLVGGEEILWLSERDGWNHLYLLDGKTGEVIRRLTEGQWVVKGVPHVDEAARIAVIEVVGRDPEQDPYHVHYASVNLDDGSLVELTEGDGTHRISWSPDGRHYLDTWSRVDHLPVHELRRFADGGLVATLAEGRGMEDLVEAGWQRPQRFVGKDRNGKYDIHGVVFRPRDFDPEKSYPVIEAIYAGPHGSFTPKEWRLRHGAMANIADAGFIVVKLDGLGTNHRGKEFQQVAYRNLIDSGFPDRIRWMRAAAAELPQMDLDRVGIYGGSAGGQSALAALLTHPGFYRAAAADCGCHDNRMDKIWWNEQWMDWPVGDHYEANANVTHIDKLEGDLLLTVGELDQNVDPSSTLQVVDALIRADKDFEFILVPGAGHGVGETPYLQRRRIEFFQESLGGPRAR